MTDRPRGGPMTAAHREALARVVARDPAAGYPEIRAEFRGLTGRDVSRPTVTKARGECGGDPAPAPPASWAVGGPRMTRCGPALTDREREILVALVAERPHATKGQVRAIFRARSGRTISPSTAADYLRGRCHPPDPRPNVPLSDAHRALLASLVADSGPEYCRAQIAREFSALSGRTLHPTMVSKFVRNKLGLPRLRAGVNSRESIHETGRRRIADARDLKFESAPVDRSPRVGRRGRANLAGGAS